MKKFNFVSLHFKEETGVSVNSNHSLREVIFSMKYLVSYKKSTKGFLETVHRTHRDYISLAKTASLFHQKYAPRNIWLYIPALENVFPIRNIGSKKEIFDGGQYHLNAERKMFLSIIKYCLVPCISDDRYFIFLSRWSFTSSHFIMTQPFSQNRILFPDQKLFITKIP